MPKKPTRKSQQIQQDKIRRTVLWLVAVLCFMVALTAASVPLYDLFCRVTGYGGTTGQATAAPEKIDDRMLEIRFNADVYRDVPWNFAPKQTKVDVHVGETFLAFYEAKNTSAEPVVGAAAFNVTPALAGKYFKKIACFCFDEQLLAPGESAEFPVSFFVDPAINDDALLDGANSITLSYTFFKAKTDAFAAARQKELEMKESWKK